jgi:type I restriction enzyme M protein
VPPDKQGDYAYLLHILRSIKPKGQGACILPHGVLFRGNAEETIRRNLIERGVIKAIIGLPANLFYGTGIPACIILLDKDGAAGRAGIFMVDASKGFRKDGNKNRLREQDLHRIVDTVARQVELPGYSRLVPVREIASEKNNFNLNLPRYIDSSTPEDLHDIDAHLHGGIPDRDIDALASYWQVVPAVRSALFDAADRPGYSQLRMPITDVKRAILDHDEFAAYRKTIEARFAKWRKTHRATLLALDKTAKPKALIETLSEELLTAFDGARLLDPYDVYQHLMDGWDAGMQDDVYLIAADGWVEAAKPKLLVEDKTKKSKQRPDLVLGKKKYVTELIPPALVIARYFAAEQRAVDKLEASYADASQQLEAFEEEHGGDDGLLSDARNDNDKLTAASVSARLREVIDDADARDEREVFERFLELIAAEVRIEIELKAAKAELNESVFEKYGALDEDAIKTLVVDDKWLAMLETALRGELDRVGQTLTGRVRELAERYAQPLPALAREIEVLAAKVDGHLAKMGLLK